jgi:hypothetical protein
LQKMRQSSGIRDRHHKVWRLAGLRGVRLRCLWLYRMGRDFTGAESRRVNPAPLIFMGVLPRQSRQKSLNRVGLSSVYLTVC